MRLLICAGMTGGGMYPALAVLQALENRAEDVLWVGSHDGLEAELLANQPFRYKAISAAGLHGVDFLRLPANFYQLFKGWQESKKIIRDFQPHVVFFTGGYLGIPMAAASRNIPSVVFVPDIEPGLALKIINRFASRIAVSTEQTISYINEKGKVKITGYPLRAMLKKWNRKNGRAHFKINAKEKVLLVFGGSKGARSINHALMSILTRLVEEMHVIHITGTDNWDNVQTTLESLKKWRSSRYHPYPFLHEKIGAAFAAADLAVCRAGASTIGELPFFGLPALLVPYPFAWKYQHQNAGYLCKNGGAEIIEDKDLQEDLFHKIMELIMDTKKITGMKKKMKSLAVMDAEQSISDLIIEVCLNGETKGGTI